MFSVFLDELFFPGRPMNGTILCELIVRCLLWFSFLALFVGLHPKKGFTLSVETNGLIMKISSVPPVFKPADDVLLILYWSNNAVAFMAFPHSGPARAFENFVRRSPFWCQVLTNFNSRYSVGSSLAMLPIVILILCVLFMCLGCLLYPAKLIFAILTDR